MGLSAPRTLALCAGAGGLELAIKLVWPGARLVGAVEREAFAAATLVARMEDATLEEAPVWDDLGTFDGRPWRGAVDLITAGFPCQPVSSAGKRLGDADVRWLWPDVARVVGEVGPQLVVLENVDDLALWEGGRLLGTVLGDLADLGFNAEWTLLSAAEVGASHLRKRIIVLAYSDDCRLSIERRVVVPLNGLAPRRHHTDRPGGAPLAHALGRRGAERAGRAHDAGRGVEPAGAVVDADEPGREGCLWEPHSGWPGSSAPGEGVPLWPPGPEDIEGWAEVVAQGGAQPAVCRMADGLADRLDRLHAIGNGVVPLMAAYAVVRLAERAGIVERSTVIATETGYVCPLCWATFTDEAEATQHEQDEEQRTFEVAP